MDDLAEFEFATDAENFAEKKSVRKETAKPKKKTHTENFAKVSKATEKKSADVKKAEPKKEEVKEEKPVEETKPEVKKKKVPFYQIF